MFRGDDEANGSDSSTGPAEVVIAVVSPAGHDYGILVNLSPLVDGENRSASKPQAALTQHTTAISIN